MQISRIVNWVVQKRVHLKEICLYLAEIISKSKKILSFVYGLYLEGRERESWRVWERSACISDIYGLIQGKNSCRCHGESFFNKWDARFCTHCSKCISLHMFWNNPEYSVLRWVKFDYVFLWFWWEFRWFRIFLFENCSKRYDVRNNHQQNSVLNKYTNNFESYINSMRFYRIVSMCWLPL